MPQNTSHKVSYLHSLERHGYSVFSISIFLLILSFAVGLILISDYRKIDKQFSSDVEIIHTRFDFYIKQNEAILEGLSAFISGVGGVNDSVLDDYAKKIIARFPHVYMLEIAEEVKRTDLKLFIKKKKNDINPDFEIRAFDYSDKRNWRQLPLADTYFPLTYIYPLPDKSLKIIGLDLTSHEHFAQPLKKAITSGDYEASLPFNLIEGKKAFVVFKAIDLGDADTAPCLVALVVVTADAFLAGIDVTDESLGLLVYHNSKNKDEPSGQLIIKEFEKNDFLPRFEFESTLESGVTGFKIQIVKQFQFKDVSWILLLIVVNISISIFFITRGVYFKNRLIQEKLLSTSQQKHKMVAMSNLTGGIAHEFNNNLSVVRGFLNLLSDKTENNSESKAWIQHAEKATEKSIDLINKLMTYSQYKGVRERVSNILINEHIIKIQKELSPLLKNNIKLECELAKEVSSALFNEDDLKEILYELIMNANDAIEGKGIISISTKKVYLTAEEKIEVEHDANIITGQYIHLMVSDTGSGINDTIKLHIFDPFFTTKAFGASSGMGLASVYGLVKLNNGYINFSSVEDRGTEFNIYIPFLAE